MKLEVITKANLFEAGERHYTSGGRLSSYDDEYKELVDQIWEHASRLHPKGASSTKLFKQVRNLEKQFRKGFFDAKNSDITAYMVSQGYNQ